MKMRFKDHYLNFAGRPPAPAPSALKEETEECSVWQNPVAPVPEPFESKTESADRAPVPERSGIVLLMTLFFIIAITLVVGVSLTQMQEANDELGESRFLAQSAVSVEDVLSMLTQLERFGDVNDTLSLNLFLNALPVIPLETPQLNGVITLASARGKININTLGAENKAFHDALQTYLRDRYNVDDAAYLTALMLDSMGGYKEDGYLTDLFDMQPWMYRDRIASLTHLEQILDFYVKSRRDGSVYRVPWNELVRFDDHNSTGLDANYVGTHVWNLLLPLHSEEEIALLSAPVFPYEKRADLPLDEETAEMLTNDFDVGFFEPAVGVSMRLNGNDAQQSSITFEYNIKTKQARNFDYAI